MVATIAILQGLKSKYEEHHGTTIQDAAIVAAARFANRYITGAFKDEKRKLVHLAHRLRERVVRQETAINLVAQAVLRSRAGLDDPGQPIGSFLFLGSTGVGKTELAKALAEQLFDSEKMLIQFDMTEFVGTHSVLRLIGAPPSYHGHEDGGQLTEKVKQRPYSVILFDEIEKADPSVFNVFLQLLDDGVLTDGMGRTVDFKNTIIIMTSNLGAEHLMEAKSGEKSIDAAHELVIQQTQKHFRPEFLNRLSELVIFEPLPQDKLKEVANVQMKGIIARVANMGITLSASDAALDVILSESHNPLYGARPVRRWLQKNVMTKLSEMLVRGEIDADTTVIIDATEDKKDLKYEVVHSRTYEVVNSWAMSASPSHRHGQQSPYKEIDLIDEACATAWMQADNLLKQNSTEKSPEIARKEVTVCAGQVAQVVREWTSIPANSFAQDEKEKLMHLADSLHKRVVGQQEAVNLVAQAVSRSKFGQNQPSQPIVSFLFLGSTGVGKTELAKSLAEQLFDIQRLIGAPASYQGHDGGGQLTDKVRKLPYSVILLDEIEKAGPEAGERLKPDLVNKLSGIVVFEPLPRDKMREVAKIQMKGIIDHFSDKGITVFASDSALDVALSQSHNPVYGARPIIRWLQMKVTNKLHEMLIKGELAADAAVIVDATEDKKDLQYIVVNDAAPPAAGEATMDSRTEANEVDQSCMFM
ncbi:hypothetical protein PR202_ga01610 [Eleusine coracana subsp. coracana]|uniref:Uncharacterized protein n=1 Tax=Eleusine coracana subsp. coracana TaxID=191504 RepID=A0AAV5BIC6_ELECO|nr:hypothetical protein PR202_ga00923 [Eleusine coracana subsp. coracana]GJM85810.1 hypothetical protein PR202_ga01610 [Eleusine coracana subsp. coracana]